MAEPRRPVGITPPPAVEENEDELLALLHKIQRERGFNCLVYKNKCLRRRIAVRMRARGQQTYAGYAELLDHDPPEFDRLLDALTINVTKFFRNPETWQLVEREVVPALFSLPHRPLRIWSAGCSSGEEPYSLAILLHDWAARQGRAAELERVTIEGTDIDRQSLELARRAEYPELSLTETPADVRVRWFSPAPPFRLRVEALPCVRFRRHDLISDPPLARCSLILCRNVIIYFDREIQERIFQAFYDALLPGGFLLLGKVETLLGSVRTLFRPIHGRDRLFQKPL